MARYIDADKCAREIRDNLGTPLGFVLTMLNNIPTADVVEVVRCKDCKYLERTDCFGECSLFNDRGDPRGEMSPNDYCSYGERKE